MAKKKKWISKARKKMERKGTVGSLHRALGVPAGEKIPASKLAKAKRSKNPALRRKANFAANVNPNRAAMRQAAKNIARKKRR